VDSFRKYCLLHGLDDIGLTLQDAGDIKAFESRWKTAAPWYFGVQA
jgi:3-isopropylmalate/(R)-2-methylmalate dehydratase small subunit